jgi:sugar phosphate permease
MTSSDPRLRRWQAVTVGTLFVGYAGYYVCRSVLPVASTLMIDDPELGLDKVGYGRLVAVGSYLYVVGKLCNGVLTEYVGGRVAFLAGMALSAACVALFGLAGGLTAFLLLWAVNRFVQSAGWVAVVQLAGRWFRPESLATVMGVLCLSYLFGDALARLYLGAFARAGPGGGNCSSSRPGPSRSSPWSGHLPCGAAPRRSACRRRRPRRGTCSGPADRVTRGCHWFNCCGRCSSARRSGWSA